MFAEGNAESLVVAITSLAAAIVAMTAAMAALTAALRAATAARVTSRQLEEAHQDIERLTNLTVRYLAEMVASLHRIEYRLAHQEPAGPGETSPHTPQSPDHPDTVG
jgi:hypothetical protein